MARQARGPITAAMETRMQLKQLLEGVSQLEFVDCHKITKPYITLKQFILCMRTIIYKLLHITLHIKQVRFN